jgi:hypothetical protein
MSNVIEQLASLGTGADLPPSDSVVRRDLARGRAALRRRRVRRGIAGVGATGAIAATALIVTTTGGPSSTAPGGLDLVVYTGTQLPGFTVEKVPEGFALQGANAYSLDVAPATDRTSLNDFRGKLVVMLQSKDVTGTPTGKAVTINGRPGTISTFDPTAKQLYYSDGTHDIVIQSATKLGLTDAELVEFAKGVTVTTEAEAGVG